MKITEITNPANVDTELIKLLKTNCSKILDVYRRLITDEDAHQCYLLRGQSSEFDVRVGESRTDRIPKDTSRYIQSLVDNWLTIQGFSAIRSNSAFSTPTASIARFYGNLYMVFPFDTATYTWGHKTDWIIEYRDLMNPDIPPPRAFCVTNVLPEYRDLFPLRTHDINRIFSQGSTFQDGVNGYISAIENFPEDQYDSLEYRDDVLKLLYNMLDDKIASKQFVKRSGLKNNVEITRAITLGKEVMIHGKYIVVNNNRCKEISRYLLHGIL